MQVAALLGSARCRGARMAGGLVIGKGREGQPRCRPALWGIPLGWGLLAGEGSPVLVMARLGGKCQFAGSEVAGTSV